MHLTVNNESLRAALSAPEYDFLYKNPNLGSNIILLTLGGSYAYGTNVEGSDIDIRGIAVNSRENLLTMHDFDKIENHDTDTVVYSLDKITGMLLEANPNVLEILNCRPEDYLYLSDAGRLLIQNRNAFLSKHVIETFAGYSSAQLHSIEKAISDDNAKEKEQQILNRIKRLMSNFHKRYTPYPDDAIRLYTDESPRPDIPEEIFMDIHLTHYPLRDYNNLWNELKNIAGQYDKQGKRNRHAMLHDKLAKHMMHLIRIYHMCFDILRYGRFATYRIEDHDLLMSVRNGYYLDPDDRPTPEFYELLKQLDSRLQDLIKTTKLPDEPDMETIRNMVMKINEGVIRHDERRRTEFGSVEKAVL